MDELKILYYPKMEENTAKTWIKSDFNAACNPWVIFVIMMHLLGLWNIPGFTAHCGSLAPLLTHESVWEFCAENTQTQLRKRYFLVVVTGLFSTQGQIMWLQQPAVTTATANLLYITLSILIFLWATVSAVEFYLTLTSENCVYPVHRIAKKKWPCTGR